MPTTSDPKLRFLKNITGFEPRDLIALDSFAILAEGCQKARIPHRFVGTLIHVDLR
jgi:hypothetical protein